MTTPPPGPAPASAVAMTRPIMARLTVMLGGAQLETGFTTGALEALGDVASVRVGGSSRPELGDELVDGLSV